MAGPTDYKMNTFYPNTILGSGYSADYNQAIQWKMPSVKPTKPTMTNPPYRTGPGTNKNVLSGSVVVARYQLVECSSYSIGV
ncbi:hypothetical protein KIN20_027074 [Parelaphostrongylus tenuis]|uniref:Uncharacterized protein n=1 Tax=Parelaphostrongylus tenuis TaxID=148309 RepID=A0AAD5QYU5_PARTN|nr:hypothetical protein KIN20_027074 [Parelaphostrongylus tenuis]